MLGKLKSEEGASLAVALLFFVVCAAMGSVILTAATVVAGRIKSLQKVDQADYTLSSATNLICEAMLDEDMSAFFSGGRVSEMDPETNHGVIVNDVKSTITAMAYYVYDRVVFDAIAGAIEANPTKNRFVVTKRTSGDEDEEVPLVDGTNEVASVTMTLEDGFSADGSKLAPVTVRFSMRDDFDVDVELEVLDENGNSTGRKAKLTFYANDVEVTLDKTLEEDDDEERSAVMNSFEVKWPNYETVS